MSKFIKLTLPHLGPAEAVLRMALEAGVVDQPDLVPGLEEARQSECCLRLALHADAKGAEALETSDQSPTIDDGDLRDLMNSGSGGGRQSGAQSVPVPPQLAPVLSRAGRDTAALDTDHDGSDLEVEDRSHLHIVMAAHVLGAAVHHQINTMTKRLLEVRTGQRGVHQRQASAGNAEGAEDVQVHQGRVEAARTLGEDQTSLGAASGEPSGLKAWTSFLKT